MIRYYLWRLVVLLSPPNGGRHRRTRLVPVTNRALWGAMTQNAWRLTAVAVGVALLLSGCGNKPDPAACEQAMRKQLAAAQATGAKGTKPKECEGLSDAQLQQIGEKVIGDSFGTTTAP